MIKYSRIPTSNKAGDFRYTKNNLITKESRIPHEVMEKFQYTPTVEYDDAPERQRCVFCDAPQSRQRYLNQETVLLCEYHYQNKSLGSIAAQIRLLKEAEQLKKEEQEKRNGLDAKSQAKGKRKLQRSRR